MNERFLVFRLEGQRYALALERVERVIAAVEVSSLPDAPPGLLGVINVAGRATPVMSLRSRLRLTEPGVRATDVFVLARSAGRAVGLHADGVVGIEDFPRVSVRSASEFADGLDRVAGVVESGDGIVVVWDAEALLSADEHEELDEALRRLSSGRSAP